MQSLEKFLTVLAYLVIIAIAGYWYIHGGKATLERMFTGTVHHDAPASWATYMNQPFNYTMSIPPGYSYDETGDPIGRLVTLTPQKTPSADVPAAISVFVVGTTLDEAIQTARDQVGQGETVQDESFNIPGNPAALRLVIGPTQKSAPQYVTEQTLFARGTNTYRATLSVTSAGFPDEATYQGLYDDMIVELATGVPKTH